MHDGPGNDGHAAYDMIDGSAPQACSAARTLLELREPVFGLTTAARVCDRWLRRDPPDVEEVRALMLQIIQTSEAATAILQRQR